MGFDPLASVPSAPVCGIPAAESTAASLGLSGPTGPAPAIYASGNSGAIGILPLIGDRAAQFIDTGLGGPRSSWAGRTCEFAANSQGQPCAGTAGRPADCPKSNPANATSESSGYQALLNEPVGFVALSMCGSFDQCGSMLVNMPGAFYNPQQRVPHVTMAT